MLDSYMEDQLIIKFMIEAYLGLKRDCIVSCAKICCKQFSSLVYKAKS